MNRFAALAILSCLAALSLAQEPVLTSLHVKNANVRDVIKQIATELNFRYQIDPNVHGTVTVDLTKKEFHEVLYAVLSQIDSIWTEEDHRFMFRPIKHPTSKTDPKVLLPMKRLVNLIDYEGADIRLVLKEQFGLQGAKYQIDPDVMGTITVSLRNVTFETALANFLIQVNATWSFGSEGVKVFLKPERDPDAPTGPPPPSRTPN